MPTTVQFRRGTTANNNAFTGSAGELSIDSTLNEIRVHDGSTAGGFAAARKTELSKMMTVANTQTLFASVAANNSTINTKMSVANTQTLHTSITANLNSYVANTNPRITNVLSSIGSTNTAIRSLVSTESSRVGLVNTNLTGTNTAIRSLISSNDTDIADRMQVANVTARFVTSDASITTKMSVANTQTLVGDRLGATASIALTGAVTGSASFSANAVSITTTATADPTITLGGDLTGNVTLTNLGNGTLTATVVDDSHNHVISNVDGLQTALDAKATLSQLTGTNTAIRSLISSNDTDISDRMQVANVTSRFVTSDASIATKMAVANTTLLVNDRLQVANATTSFALKADLASPTLTGTPVAPTAANTTSTTQIATTAFVQNVVDMDIAALANSAPVTLNTLNELAAALGDDANFATTLTTNLGQKLGAGASVALTGDVSGTANFSSNAVSITTTIADDSHNHVVSNVDGLQTALDAKATLSQLTGTNTAIRTLVSDRMQVANVTARFVTSDASIATKMSVANTQALFATVSANNATINKKMSVANTQTLHTSVTANLNSYIANTNPRITNILSSITGTNTAIRTLVSDRMQTANTTLLVNDRMQVANVTSLLANKLNITDSGQGFSESTVFEFPTGNYDGSDSYIGQTTVDAFGVALSNIFSCMEPIGSTDAVDLGTL